MSRRIIPVLVLGMLALSLWAGPAHSQTVQPTITPTPTGSATPTPTPTVTSTPAVMSGEHLLDLSSAAAAAKNSYRMVMNISLVIPKQERGSTKIQMDISNKPALIHELATSKVTTLSTRPHKIKTQHLEAIGDNNAIALRTGHKAWQCISLSQATEVPGMPPSETTGSVNVESLDNLGQETLSGRAVWHVREVMTMSDSGQTMSMTIDFYIAQSDYTMVHEAVAESMPIQGTTLKEKATADYSRYGEAIHVTLPAACKGTKDLALTIGPRVLWPMQLSIQLMERPGRR